MLHLLKHICVNFGGSRSGLIMGSEENVRLLWRTCDCVCLDVDSTVCIDEGIDELAAFLGKGDEVANLTRNAMQGSLTYQESLCKRLDILRPSHDDISNFISHHPPRLTAGVKDLVFVLHQREIPVFLISGGFTSIITPVAQELNIPLDKLIANKLLFYYDGQFAGFDEKIPVCKSGGKPEVIERLKKSFGFKKLIHIGDGVTDMEACPPADAFIGFGGNQVREKVRAGSEWFIMDFQELIKAL